VIPAAAEAVVPGAGRDGEDHQRIVLLRDVAHRAIEVERLQQVGAGDGDHVAPGVLGRTAEERIRHEEADHVAAHADQVRKEDAVVDVAGDLRLQGGRLLIGDRGVVLLHLVGEIAHQDPLQLAARLRRPWGEDDRFLPGAVAVDLRQAAGDHGDAAGAGHPVGVDVDVEINRIETETGHCLEHGAEVVDRLGAGLADRAREGGLEPGAVAVRGGGEGEQIEIAAGKFIIRRIDQVAVAVVVPSRIGESEELRFREGRRCQDKSEEKRGGEVAENRTAVLHNVSKVHLRKPGKDPAAPAAGFSEAGSGEPPRSGPSCRPSCAPV